MICLILSTKYRTGTYFFIFPFVTVFIKKEYMTNSNENSINMQENTIKPLHLDIVSNYYFLLIKSKTRLGY